MKRPASLEIKPRTPDCAASALPLSYNNRTTTNCHNPVTISNGEWEKLSLQTLQLPPKAICVLSCNIGLPTCNLALDTSHCSRISFMSPTARPVYIKKWRYIFPLQGLCIQCINSRMVVNAFVMSSTQYNRSWSAANNIANEHIFHFTTINLQTIPCIRGTQCYFA